MFSKSLKLFYFKNAYNLTIYFHILSVKHLSSSSFHLVEHYEANKKQACVNNDYHYQIYLI